MRHYLLALSVFAGACAPAVAIPGDLNNDGVVNAVDAVIASHMRHGRTPPNLANGDVASATGLTPDGVINEHDIRAILRNAGGLLVFNGGPGPVGANPLPKTETVTVSGNTVRDIQLPGGFRLTGTISPPPTSFFMSFGIDFIRQGTNDFFSGDVEMDGSYAAIVPSGTFAAELNTFETVIDFSTGAFSQRNIDQTLPGTFSVTADTTRNFTRPALPATGTVSGSITTTNFEPSMIQALADNASGSTAVTGATYTISPYAGTYQMSVIGAPSGASSVSTMVRLAPNVVVPAGGTVTQNVNLAALQMVTGTLTLPANSQRQFLSYATSAQTGDQWSSFSSQGGTSYQVAVPTGAYNVSINLRSTTSPGTSFMWNSTANVPAGGGAINFTLPALPALVSLSGKVTGPTGAPVPQASVGAILTSAPIGGYVIYGSATTDAAGNYTMFVPNGTYMLTAYPPDPDED
jgi:hypothetical protein